MNTPNTPHLSVLRLARWTLVALLLGRAWQHLFWDAPVRALVWSESDFGGMVRLLFGMDWGTWATSPTVADGIYGFIRGWGVLYLALAVAAAVVTDRRRWAQAGLVVAWLSLFALSYLYYRDKLFRLGEWIEYGSQFLLPIVVLGLVRGWSLHSVAWTARVAVALTFLGHGLYAIGYYPTSGEWVTMTMILLPVTDGQALQILRVAGALDLAVVVAIFLPAVARPALLYAATWGLLTALARGASFIRWDNFSESAAYWTHETVVRLPHAVVPLIAWLLLRPAPSSASAPLSSVSTPPNPTLTGGLASGH